MKFKVLLLFLLTLAFLNNISANRTLYIDSFSVILGDSALENKLLRYADANNFKTLLCYELHIVNSNIGMTNSATNFVLADFIQKAKTQYNIESVGAVAESPDFFTNIIDVYNNTRSNSLEKFDIYNLEFEYWINASIEPGGYYCSTYLNPNGYPCTRNGAFQYYISILETMNSLAISNTHEITTEAYVGWPTAGEADTIGKNVDKLLLHSYVQNPNTTFSYAEDRIIDFANGNPNLKVSIIFSAEQVFMQNWLENNSMSAAEEIFTNDFDSVSASWTNNINLQDFTYFTYGKMSNISEPVISVEEPNNISSENLNEITFKFSKNIVSLESKYLINEASIFNINNEKINTFSNEKNLRINIEDYPKGIYFLKVNIKSKAESFKFLKMK